MFLRPSILVASVLLIGIAAPAHAEIPSVDAYGGEALVLGKPHHRRQANPNGANGTSRSGDSNRSSSSNDEGSGTIPPAGKPPGGTGNAGGTSSGTGAPSGSSTGAPQPPPHGAHATGPAAGGSQAGSHTDSGASAAREQGAGTSPAQDLAYAYPTATTKPSGAGALGTGDILLIVAGLLCIVGVGVVLRRTRRIA